MQAFKSHLEVLPPAQRKLWPEFSAVPGEFVLYGGTALALHLGHRDSVDFDFFSDRAINLAALEAKIPFLKGARIIQREANTLSAVVERGGRYALPEDMRFIRKYVSDDDFRDALDHAPPGIIDPRSWAYWNSKMGRYPPPPHPVRNFGAPTDERDPDHDAQRRYGASAWLRVPDKSDPEEVRRQAAQRWRTRYGPK